MSKKLSADEITRLQEEKIEKLFKDKELTELDKKACLGRVYHDLEQYDTAIELFTEVLEADENNVIALEGRANAHRIQDNDIAALEDMNKAIALDGETLRRISHRGDLHLKLHNDKESLADFNWVIQRFGDSKFRNLRRADVLNRFGRYVEALKDANIVFELGENSYYAYKVRGLAHLKLGHLEEAASDFSEAIKLYPKFSYAYAYRGAAYLEQGKFENAESDFEKALVINKNSIAQDHLALLRAQRELVQKHYPDNPTEVDQLEALARAYLDKHMNDSVFRVLTRVIDMDSTRVFALEQRGELYRFREEYSEAIADLNEALELNPDSVFALTNRAAAHLERRDFQRAVEDFTRVIEIDSGMDVYSMKFCILRRARAYNGLGQYNEALQDANHAIDDLEEQSYLAYHTRGLALLRLGQFQPALDDFTKAINCSSREYQAYELRGEAFLNLGEIDQAEQDLRRACKLNQNSQPAIDLLNLIIHQKEWVNRLFQENPSTLNKLACLGAAAINCGRHEDALKRLTSVLEEDPHHKFALEKRALVYYFQGRNDLALVDIKAAIGTDDDYEPTQYRLELRGEIYRHLGEWQNASDDFSRTLNTHGETAFSLTRHAYVLVRLDKPREALPKINKSINELGDTSALAYNTLGLAYLARNMSGDEKEAEKAFTLAIEAHPDEIDAYLHRADLYLKNRFPDERKLEIARGDLEKALEIDPNSRAAQELSVKLEKAIQAAAESEELSSSEENENNDDDNSSSSSSTEEDKDDTNSSEDANADKPSYALTLRMLKALYEQQQEAKERHQKTANILYVVGIFVAPGLAHLAVFLIKLAMHWNDVKKMSNVQTEDTTFKRWKFGKEWQKASEANGENPENFDLYFYNDKTLKKANALYKKQHGSTSTHERDTEQEFDSEVTASSG